jgi:hypothetical protein
MDSFFLGGNNDNAIARVADIVGGDVDALAAAGLYADGVGTATLGSAQNYADLGDANERIASDARYANNNADRMTSFFEFDEVAGAIATSAAAFHWTGGGTDGTQAIAATANGSMLLDTTATGSRSSSLTYSAAGALALARNPVVSFRAVTDAITHRDIQMGFYVDGNDYAYFNFDTAVSATALTFNTRNNAGGVNVVGTGLTMDDANHDYEIRLFADGSVQAFVDGVEVADEPAATVRAGNWVPYFRITNKAEAQSNTLGLDYVKISIDRD